MANAGKDADGGVDEGAVEIEEIQHYFLSARALRAATAGSSLPSRNSRNAPPPVEMYETPASMPYLSTAATASPPPATATPFAAAIARARVSVPWPTASNSNTPTGPFQTTVPA